MEMWSAKLTSSAHCSDFLPNPDSRLTETDLYWRESPPPRTSQRNRIQRPYLGNFDVHTGYPRFQASRAFAFWSDLKRRTFDRRGPRYFFTFLGLAAAVAMLLAAQRRTLPQGAVAGGVVLIGMAFTALCVASLADAVDVPRHHLLFYVLFDMLLVVLVHLSVGAWLARKRQRRNIAASVNIGVSSGGVTLR
jgi:hypothetical protein